MLDLAKDCFVIMPFDEKTGPTGRKVNFDSVYQDLIRPSIEKAGLEPKRADEILGGNPISSKMFRALADYPYAIADATFLNPNVYYELGVRHAMKKCVTIAIKDEDTDVPFDVRDVPFFSYKLSESGQVVDPENTVERLASHIRACKQHSTEDSPVWQHVEGLRVKWSHPYRIGAEQSVLYDLKENPTFQVGIRTGNLDDVTDIDGWANSENNYMEMARIVDRSISSFIRYNGAERSPGGKVTKDTVFEALKTAAEVDVPAALGSVYNTTSGELEFSHNVKRIFHVATVSATPVGGFKPGDQPGIYVRNLVRETEKYNREAANDPALKPVSSILIPIFGTGSARGDPDEIIDQLLDGAVLALRSICGRDDTCLKTIYFLGFSAREVFPMERSFAKFLNHGDLVARHGPQFDVL